VLRINEPTTIIPNETSPEEEQRYADLVFCLPGRSENRKIERNLWDTWNILRDNGIPYAIQSEYMSNVYASRNGCLSRPGNKRADQIPFEGEFDYGRMIWADADNEWTYNHLGLILRHDQPVVFGWCHMAPGPMGQEWVNCGFVENGRHRTITEEELLSLPRNGSLVEVDWAGFAFAKVEKGVFEAIGYPWFRSWVHLWREAGVKMADIANDDAGWCWRVKRKGFKIMVDVECQVGHWKSKRV
jgi:hypothetical protein